MNYFFIEVYIIINSDRIYNFSLNEFSIGFLLKLVFFKFEIFKKGLGGVKIKYVKVIWLGDMYLIFNFKFGNIELFNLKSVYGILILVYYYIV